MAGLRKVAYLISALAVACFFLFPEPATAMIGALLLQTLAFIVIAGRSTADGIVLAGITVLMMGLMPADHPLVREAFYGTTQPWIIAVGAALVVSGLLLIGRQINGRG